MARLRCIVNESSIKVPCGEFWSIMARGSSGPTTPVTGSPTFHFLCSQKRSWRSYCAAETRAMALLYCIAPIARFTWRFPFLARRRLRCPTAASAAEPGPGSSWPPARERYCPNRPPTCPNPPGSERPCADAAAACHPPPQNDLGQLRTVGRLLRFTGAEAGRGELGEFGRDMTGHCSRVRADAEKLLNRAFTHHARPLRGVGGAKTEAPVPTAPG